MLHLQGGGGRACWIAWTTTATQLCDGWELVSPDVVSAEALRASGAEQAGMLACRSQSVRRLFVGK
ncbi:MAG: hypothetical protein ACYDGY_03245 [Acidimicrobiales bacterium]